MNNGKFDAKPICCCCLTLWNNKEFGRGSSKFWGSWSLLYKNVYVSHFFKLKKNHDHMNTPLGPYSGHWEGGVYESDYKAQTSFPIGLFPNILKVLLTLVSSEIYSAPFFVIKLW